MRTSGFRVRLVPLLVVLAVAVGCAVALGVVWQRRQEQRGQGPGFGCQSDIKQIGLAMIMYADAHDGRLPFADGWATAVVPILGSPAFLICPSDRRGSKLSYAMVRGLSGARLGKVPHPETQPMVYEADAQGRFASRHHGKASVIFADGHFKWLEQARPGVPPAAP